jgi:hypothetical protein
MPAKRGSFLGGDALHPRRGRSGRIRAGANVPSSKRQSPGPISAEIESHFHRPEAGQHFEAWINKDGCS